MPSARLTTIREKPIFIELSYHILAYASPIVRGFSVHVAWILRDTSEGFSMNLALSFLGVFLPSDIHGPPVLEVVGLGAGGDKAEAVDFAGVIEFYCC